MEKKRYLYIDILNCMAIFAVLVQHTAQIAHQGNPNEQIIIIGNILQTIFLPAVGIFFMNSGAMLLDYRYRQSTKEFFKKRFLRVVVPFLIWSVFYYWYSYHYYAFPGIFHRNVFSLRDFVQSFVDDKINSLFWFFFSIIQLYLATPVFAVLAKKYKDILAYVVVVGVAYGIVVPYIAALKGVNLSSGNINVPLLNSSWITYYVMGYLIKEDYLSDKIQMTIIALGTLNLGIDILNDIFVNKIVYFNNLGTMFYTFGLYILIKRLTNHARSERVTKFFAVLSSASLGIYVLHPLFIQLFDWYLFHVTPKVWDSYFEVLQNPIHIYVYPFVLYLVMAPIVLLIKKFKLMKYILP